MKKFFAKYFCYQKKKKITVEQHTTFQTQFGVINLVRKQFGDKLSSTNKFPKRNLQIEASEQRRHHSNLAIVE